MKIKSGTSDQGWELVDRLDHDNVKSHPFSGKGADLTINLVVKQGTQVIGGVAASSDDYGIGYLEMLWVDPMFRRQGIGQALLVAVEQALLKAGCRKVRLETFDYQAPAFYRANQYQVFGKLHYAHAALTEYFFVKPLQLQVSPVLPATYTLASWDDAAMTWIEDQFEAENLAKKPLLQEKPGITFTFLAEEDGQCVGGIFGYSAMYRIGYIEALWVAPAYRRKGLGTRLVNQLLAAFKEINCPIVHLDTLSFQGPKFYPALGFQQFGTVDYPDSDVSELFFVKLIQD